MDGKARILAFSGSARTNSFNKKLIAIAAEGARGAGAEVTLLDLRDYEMPIYDGDLEDGEGLPANAVKLRDLFAAHDGLLIAAPEYNASITPLLKNVIDWVSRPTDKAPMLSFIAGKTAAVVSASPGGLGGLRGLVHLRQILDNIGVTVIPNQATIRDAANAFDDGGALKNDSQRDAVQAVAARLAAVTASLIP